MEQEGRRRVALLGSTGSIGTQTLEVARRHPDKVQLVALACNTQAEVLLAQAEEFGVSHVALGNKRLQNTSVAEELREQIDSFGAAQNSSFGSLGFGPEAVCDLVRLPEVDVVVNALVGEAGMRASYETLRAGKVLALANKESLVVAGDLLMPLAAKLDAHRCQKGEVPRGTPAASLMPIDSEHGAIFQCLIGEKQEEVACLWVTASGGPFRGFSRDQLAQVSAKQALKHPTWHMGAKISIDSASLMNKGLEVIEAHHLFSLPYERIKVVIQPQSAIHSMVEFSDGSVKAHLGTTDMRIPIQYALSYPARWEAPVTPLDFCQLGSLEFAAPDAKTFRCLELARVAGSCGGTLPCAMNAANEIAVAAFLADRIGFLDIEACVETVMQTHHKAGVQRVESLEQLEEIDLWARHEAQVFINTRLS